MFENLGHFFKRMVKTEQQKELGSKDAAKERLHLVLMQDRANVSADFLELMKQEIIDVIKKYIEVDEDLIDVRLTNKSNDDGTNGAPSLYANIPIVNIKNDMMAEKIKSFEGVDFNKEMGIPVKEEYVPLKQPVEPETPSVIELSASYENNGETQVQTPVQEYEQETEREVFEEVDDEEDDDVTFDDLLKAAEAADRELKEQQNSENVETPEIPPKEKTSRSRSGSSKKGGKSKSSRSKGKRK